MALDKKAFFALTTDLTSGASYLKVFTPATTTVIAVYSGEDEVNALSPSQVSINQTTGVAVFWVAFGTYDIKIYNTAGEQVGTTLNNVYITRPAEAGDNVDTTLGIVELDTRLKKGAFGTADADQDSIAPGVILLKAGAMVHRLDGQVAGDFTDIKRWTPTDTPPTVTAIPNGEVVILYTGGSGVNSIRLLDGQKLRLGSDRSFYGNGSIMLIKASGNWYELSYQVLEGSVTDLALDNRQFEVSAAEQAIDLKAGDGVYELFASGTTTGSILGIKWAGHQIPHSAQFTLINRGTTIVSLVHGGSVGTNESLMALPGNADMSLGLNDTATFMAVGPRDSRAIKLVHFSDGSTGENGVTADVSPRTPTIAVAASTSTLLLTPQGDDASGSEDKKANIASARDIDYDLLTITGGYPGQIIKVTVDHLDGELAGMNLAQGYIKHTRNIRGSNRLAHPLEVTPGSTGNGKIFLNGWSQLLYEGVAGNGGTPSTGDADTDYCNSDCRIMAGDYLTLIRRGTGSGLYWWEELDRRYDKSIQSVMGWTGTTDAASTTAPTYNVKYSLACLDDDGSNLTSVGVWRPTHGVQYIESTADTPATVKRLNEDMVADFELTISRFNITGQDVEFGVSSGDGTIDDGGIRGQFGQDNNRGGQFHKNTSGSNGGSGSPSMLIRSAHCQPPSNGGDFGEGTGPVVRWHIIAVSNELPI